MPRITEEGVRVRREEIINACEKLYQTMSFKDITIKEIGNTTSFTRTSIYNYFQTKEEIFLALLQREYKAWVKDLNSILSENDSLSRDELASLIAHTLENRGQMLKLLSMNLYDIETNSRLENLSEFKKVCKTSFLAVSNILDKFAADKREDEKRCFIYSFYPFMFGIYPYTNATEKQLNAMKEAEIDIELSTIYELSYNTIRKLLS